MTDHSVPPEIVVAEGASYFTNGLGSWFVTDDPEGEAATALRAKGFIQAWVVESHGFHSERGEAKAN